MDTAITQLMELALPMTDAMTAIYGAIGDLMAGCMKELRASNKIDASELKLENGLFKSFDDIVRRQLDAVWHTVSFRTKQVCSNPTNRPLKTESSCVMCHSALPLHKPHVCLLHWTHQLGPATQVAQTCRAARRSAQTSKSRCSRKLPSSHTVLCFHPPIHCRL